MELSSKGADFYSITRYCLKTMSHNVHNFIVFNECVLSLLSAH